MKDYCALKRRNTVTAKIVELKADKRMFDAYRNPCIAADIDGSRMRWKENRPPFDFGYVLTCHSAQGSEWGKVLVVDDFSRWKYDPEGYRRWLYTAITRASKELVIVDAK